MTIPVDSTVAKRLSMLAISMDTEADERRAAVHCMMAAAMLMAFSKQENPNADLDALIDEWCEKLKEFVREMEAPDKDKQH